MASAVNSTSGSGLRTVEPLPVDDRATTEKRIDTLIHKLDHPGGYEEPEVREAIVKAFRRLCSQVPQILTEQEKETSVKLGLLVSHLFRPDGTPSEFVRQEIFKLCYRREMPAPAPLAARAQGAPLSSSGPAGASGASRSAEEEARLNPPKRPRPEPSAPSGAATPLARPPIPCFGKDEWVQFFGDIGEVPHLPHDINLTLAGPCPFTPGKKVHETHVLVLVPKTVKNMPFTLNAFANLVRSPRQGHKAEYWSLGAEGYQEAQQLLGAKQPEKSYWILMTKNVLPETRRKSYTDQSECLNQYVTRTGMPYTVPTTLEAVTGILCEYVRSGNTCYNNDPWTWTRCTDKVNRYQMVVGGSILNKFDVLPNTAGDDPGVGLAPVRKL